MKKTKQALVLNDRDNVATVLCDTATDDILALKGSGGTVRVNEKVPYGHKAALRKIDKDEAVVKYGHRIGIATTDIAPGDWVHLHNMTSAFDVTFKKRIDSCTVKR